jgi:enoyl-CoA hydratase/carnithine racemase
MCDVRVVASGTKLGILEANYGLVPDLGGTHRLPALVGPGVAKKMIWLAEKIDADEAHRIGLAEIVCPPDQLGAVTDDLAIRLAAAPPIPVRAAKSLVDGALRRSLDEHMDAEALAQQKVFASADFLEAMTAFMQKREPSYTGA